MSVDQDLIEPPTAPLKICVIGSGNMFVSGISYYTYYLVQSLSSKCEVSAIVLRRLIPKRLYPGKARVGSPIMEHSVSELVPTFDGINWWLIPSLFSALRFMRKQRPDVVVFQWWTGSAIVSYLCLGLLSIARGTRLIIEFHEDLDTGEASFRIVHSVILALLKLLTRRAHGFVVHSAWDKSRLVELLCIDCDSTFVIPHGPYPMAKLGQPAKESDRGGSCHDVETEGDSEIEGGSGACTILFFGTIRPYKGLEYLIRAFSSLPRDQGQVWRLLIVGEVWEGWSLPIDLAETSPFSTDIEVIDRYVDDSEIPGIFARASIAVLPYLRSSASGPLHLAMNLGLPIVLSKVGGLEESADGYKGAVFVDPGQSEKIVEGIIEAASLAGCTFLDPRSWDETARIYLRVFSEVLSRPSHLRCSSGRQTLARRGLS